MHFQDQNFAYNSPYFCKPPHDSVKAANVLFSLNVSTIVSRTYRHSQPIGSLIGSHRFLSVHQSWNRVWAQKSHVLYQSCVRQAAKCFLSIPFHATDLHTSMITMKFVWDVVVKRTCFEVGGISLPSGRACFIG